jgi:nucleotide-binding universal stress UspA family protein
VIVIASAYRHTPHVRMDGSAFEGLARSVTERVLHHRPCPVAVVQPAEDEPSFARIGVALDDKAPARAALAAAVAQAERLGDAVEGSSSSMPSRRSRSSTTRRCRCPP